MKPTIKTIERSVARKKRITQTVLWLACILALSFLLSYVGATLTAKRFLSGDGVWKPLLAQSSVLFVTLALLFLYGRYQAQKHDMQCSVFKGTVILLLTVSMSTLFSIATASYYSPYAVCIVLASLMITVLLNQHLAILSTLSAGVCAVVVFLGTKLFFGFGVSAGDFLGIVDSMSAGLAMIFLLHRGYTRFKLTVMTILVSLLMMPFSVLGALSERLSASALLMVAINNFLGNLIGITLFTVLLPIYELCTRIWTDFKLAEVCSFKQPLLRELKEKAPGTFNHCLTVGNLMESCAMAIGLNPYMARACAYFHDVGKLKNPQFFVENQRDGYNPHDELIPEVSASMITRHTAQGAETLRRYGMPDIVVKAAREHHGDSAVMYFYYKAKAITEGDLDTSQFRYDGPLPSTKYSAVLMICDVCEAITRAKVPENESELEETVGKVIRDKLTEGQFDDCDLTVKDMAEVKHTICEVIPAMLHKRIDYNKAKELR